MCIPYGVLIFQYFKEHDRNHQYLQSNQKFNEMLDPLTNSCPIQIQNSIGCIVKICILVYKYVNFILLFLSFNRMNSAVLSVTAFLVNFCEKSKLLGVKICSKYTHMYMLIFGRIQHKIKCFRIFKFANSHF